MPPDLPDAFEAAVRRGVGTALAGRPSAAPLITAKVERLPDDSGGNRGGLDAASAVLRAAARSGDCVADDCRPDRRLPNDWTGSDEVC